MRFLRKSLDKIKVHFDKGGKLENFKPAFSAFDTLLYVPNTVTHSGVHIRSGVDLKRVMITVILALMPCLFFGIYNVGYQHYSQLEGSDVYFLDAMIFGLQRVVPMILVSYGVGLGIEFLFAIKRKHEVNEGFLVSGMLIPMIMPVDLPLWMLAVSVVFAVVLGKEIFGGTGMNILNPALTARAFLFFAYPTFMSGDKVWVADSMILDGISGETILGQLAQNKPLVSSVGSDIHYTVYDMFMGSIPGSIAETSVLAILIGAFFLIYTGIGSWQIMFSAVVGASAIGLLFNAVAPEGNSLMSFPWWNHMLVGGFAFGVVFMATDPVSAAQTNKGKYIYGFLVGVFSILIRVFNPAYPEGVMLAILFMNVFAPTIDHYVIQANIKRRKKRLKLNRA
ncbi:NADH:ubiquinone reductase (Na(+)-transporting) subunit B [Ichthyobacterium seriolicida]|uniref:Na(+)-translocating NADH-quinone reductase subunit B n=1 Tax=Ichthyobacterium seriolicida TaxID=242600 RepID=A0A1J1E7H4_9FLAO|nr:NADH:ubiquinone reductase (Na(+)-transporting) subunit B [Ichthyobacterium seriolicida]BAV95278.1 Na(+)-translocating NADH-quinone reductase subunit B [Ichthyobacterium seriolicida]